MLIVLEATDGSGKYTQTKLLYERLKEDKNNVIKIEYPNYNSDSSALVKMYLNGELGENAKEVSPYVASSFYAVDRIADYLKNWKKYYDEDYIVIADRYTTSNMVHQAGKIQDAEQREQFLNWVYDYEFNLLGLPKPDLVFFLDVPPEYNEKLMKNRDVKDIHEKDFKHLQEAYNNAKDLINKYNWVHIKCIKENELRSIEDIHEELYKNVINNFKNNN